MVPPCPRPALRWGMGVKGVVGGAPTGVYLALFPVEVTPLMFRDWGCLLPGMIHKERRD